MEQGHCAWPAVCMCVASAFIPSCASCTFTDGSEEVLELCFAHQCGAAMPTLTACRTLPREC